MYLDVTSRSKWVGEADYDLVALPSRSTENGFLGRSYPVQRELFVITGKALSSFKGHVSQHEEPEEWVSDWFP